MNKDYYEILGIDRNADEETIKKAYRKLAIQYHPDKQVGKSDSEKKVAEEKFKEVNEAYSVLGDKEKKLKYDMYGTAEENFSNYSADDIADMVRKHFGMDFDTFFGGFGGPQVKRKGKDIKLNVRVKLSEVYNGGTKTVTYEPIVLCEHCHGTGAKDGKVETCKQCGGTGQISERHRTAFGYAEYVNICPSCKGRGVIFKDVCNHCGGKGLVRKNEKYSFVIPKGATNNVYFTVPGRGNVSPDGIAGNLIIFFIVEPEKGITVSTDNNVSYNLSATKEISVLDCITGCDASIDHIDGKTYKFNIKPGTKDGFKVRLKDKGLPDKNGRRGFLDVTIRMKMPKTLSKEDKKTIENLKKSKNFK